MTINERLKNNVRRFADINGINYTAALREFDVAVGQPASKTRHRTSGPDYAAEVAWAAARGLKRNDGTGCFHELSNESGRVGYREKYHRFNDPCSSVTGGGYTALKDHGRSYMFRGPNDARARTAVLTFAPYNVWEDEELAQTVRLFATEYDIRYRVGYDRDATYGSGTVPVVFWNPRVIDLG